MYHAQEIQQKVANYSINQNNGYGYPIMSTEPTASTPIRAEHLEHAIRDEKICLHYQPKVNLVSGEICAAEALARWVTDEGYFVPPVRFITLAEKSGLIRRLTLYLYQRLIKDMEAIHQINSQHVVSFNVTASDLQHNNFITMLKNSIDKQFLKPDLLELEITETIQLPKHQALRDMLNEITGLGVNIAMDDFGTGYSSIDTLNKHHFSAIKIDRGLVSEMTSSSKSLQIIDASIKMAHTLGMKVIAEGVETAQEMLVLSHLGCDISQGYYISKPLALADYLSFLKNNHQWPGFLIGFIHLAITSHITWYRNFMVNTMSIYSRKQGSHVCGESPPFPEPEFDHHLCHLGKWFYGIGQHHNNSPLFQQLEVPHARLHQIGHDVWQQVHAGVDIKTLESRMDELSQISTHLISLLQKLELEELLNCATTKLPAAC